MPVFIPQFGPFERPLRMHGMQSPNAKPGGPKPVPAPIAKRRPPEVKDVRETTAVVEFTYQSNWERPLFPITGLPFPAPAMDISDPTIELKIPAAPTPALVNPFSDAMITYLYMWNRNTLNTITTDNVWFSKALLFFNLTRIKAKFPALTELKFKIAAPGGRFLNPTASVIWWVWDSIAATSLDEAILHPFTTGFSGCPGPFCSPGGIIVIPVAFASEAEANLFASVGPGQPFLVVESRATSDKFSTNLSWNTRLSSYPKPPLLVRRDFPSDPPGSVDIDWNPNTESASHTQASGTGPDPGATARNIVYHVSFSSLATAITST